MSTQTLREQIPVRKLYSVEETMVLLNVGRTRLYELFDSSELVRVKLGRSTRVTAESIDGYIDRLVSSGADAAAS